MHIVFVSNYAPPYEGGIQFVIGKLCEYLTSRQHKTTIIACNTGIRSGIQQVEGITRIGVPAWNGLERHSIPYPLFNPLALWKVLEEILPSADAIHIHGVLYMDSVLAAWYARRKKIPVVLTEHVGFVAYDNALLKTAQSVAMHTVGRLCCRSSDSVVVLNQRVYDEMRRLVPRSARLLKIVNGVDAHLFKPVSSEEKMRLRAKWGFTRPTVAFVGRLSKKKGIDLLLEATRQSQQFEVVICGKDTEHIVGCSARIIGLLGQPELAEIYQAADLLALPSEGEGFPLVVQEAMACGLPVVVTDNSVNREYLDETVAHFVPREPRAIASALDELLANTDRRLKMGDAARKWAVEHYSWDRTVSQYLELYSASEAI